MSRIVSLVPSVDDWQDVIDVPDRLGWQEQDEPDSGFDRTWAVPGHAARVHWLDDAVLDVEMFVVTGTERDVVARRIREEVSIFSPADVAALVGPGDDADHLRSVLRFVGAVAISEEASPELVSIFNRGLEHSSREVRVAALFAVAAPKWREMRGAVQQIARTDPEQGVREIAERVVAIIDRANPSSVDPWM